MPCGYLGSGVAPPPHSPPPCGYTGVAPLQLETAAGDIPAGQEPPTVTAWPKEQRDHVIGKPPKSHHAAEPNKEAVCAFSGVAPGPPNPPPYCIPIKVHAWDAGPSQPAERGIGPAPTQWEEKAGGGSSCQSNAVPTQHPPALTLVATPTACAEPERYQPQTANVLAVRDSVGVEGVQSVIKGESKVLGSEEDLENFCSGNIVKAGEPNRVCLIGIPYYIIKDFISFGIEEAKVSCCGIGETIADIIWQLNTSLERDPQELKNVAAAEETPSVLPLQEFPSVPSLRNKSSHHGGGELQRGESEARHVSSPSVMALLSASETQMTPDPDKSPWYPDLSNSKKEYPPEPSVRWAQTQKDLAAMGDLEMLQACPVICEPIRPPHWESIPYQILKDLQKAVIDYDLEAPFTRGLLDYLCLVPSF
ncbi:hypothetical protein WISP_14534 [Willisornis vidua]|uniref:Uncharacterized protein n=1 Tax=Willisornis vidua TaxID=1566151 RepID=A0ABQ9DQ93_9PASS|nr:hypothetical protein WISP_14534 [Willisornis vidua]